MSEDRETLRTRLAAAGFRPSRALGQNFLFDRRLLAAIADAARIEPGDFVLEVGAGVGTLSRELAARSTRLVAVEIDPRLASLAREALAEFAQARVLELDALDGKHALAPALARELPGEGRWLLVANLPYSIASPLLVLVSRCPNPPERMVALVQAEVAERIAAEPGGRSYGPLGVRLRLAYDARVVRRVGPAAFWPAPEVDSALLVLDRLAGAPSPRDWPAIDRVVDVLFHQRRKQIRSGLAQLGMDRKAVESLADELGIDTSSRAESLPPQAFRRIAQGSSTGSTSDPALASGPPQSDATAATGEGSRAPASGRRPPGKRRNGRAGRPGS